MPRSRSSEPRDRAGHIFISATGSCRSRRRKTSPRWSPRSMENRAGKMQRPPESTSIERKPAPALGLRGFDKAERQCPPGHLRTVVRGPHGRNDRKTLPLVSQLQVVELWQDFRGRCARPPCSPATTDRRVAPNTLHLCTNLSTSQKYRRTSTGKRTAWRAMLNLVR